MSAITPEKARAIRQASHEATLALGMMTIVFEVYGQTLSASVFPWECLDKAREFWRAGARNLVLVHHGETWLSPPKGKRWREPKSLVAKEG